MFTPLRIATVQSEITDDVRRNGHRARAALQEAAAAGARVVHFPEAALSGYVKAQVRSWGKVDWAALADEVADVAATAGALGVWVVIGCNRWTGEARRPFNSQLVISDAGRVQTPYDKRFCSHTEITDWYDAGTMPVTFDVDGVRFGCALCIEICFPEVFAEYERLGVDCMLLSAYSADPIYGVMARAHAATNCTWFSLAVPAACSHGLPSALIGPDGNVIAACAPGAGSLIEELDPADPRFDIALNRARPWRARARRGESYRGHAAVSTPDAVR